LQLRHSPVPGGFGAAGGDLPAFLMGVDCVVWHQRTLPSPPPKSINRGGTQMVRRWLGARLQHIDWACIWSAQQRSSGSANTQTGSGGAKLHQNRKHRSRRLACWIWSHAFPLGWCDWGMMGGGAPDMTGSTPNVMICIGHQGTHERWVSSFAWSFQRGTGFTSLPMDKAAASVTRVDVPYWLPAAWSPKGKRISSRLRP